MYVQIDTRLRDALMRNVVACGLMGSHAYGLNTESSDMDILHLYYDPEYANSFTWVANGWQYKNGGTDENYQEIRHYIRNLIIGESPADYDVLKSGFVVGDSRTRSIPVLFNALRESCVSYSLIKSFIGYIKKDYGAYTSVDHSHRHEVRKRVSHMVRGLSVVNHLLGIGPYQFDGQVGGREWELCKRILDGDVSVTELDVIADGIKDESDGIRTILNDSLNAQRISRRMNVDAMKRIDDILCGVINELSDIQFDRIDYGNYRYDVIEKGVTHQYQ